MMLTIAITAPTAHQKLASNCGKSGIIRQVLFYECN